MSAARTVLRQVKVVARAIKDGPGVWRGLHTRGESPPAPSDQVVLFFAPDAAVEVHYALATMVARILREHGERVQFVRCFRVFERCTIKSMYRLGSGTPSLLSSAVCVTCFHASQRCLADYGLPWTDLDSVLTPEVRAEVDAALSNLPADLQNFTYDGVALGKIAAHDFALVNKLVDFSTLSKSLAGDLRQLVQTCLLSYVVTRHLCRSGVRALVYVNDTSMSMSARLAAAKLGVPVYSLAHAPHCGVDRSLPTIATDFWMGAAIRQGAAWPAWRDLSLPPARAHAIGDDIIYRLSARSVFVYSSPLTAGESGVHARLGLRPDKKLIVAFTSSLDEDNAHNLATSGMGLERHIPEQPFTNQLDWLARLTEFCESRDDLQLVIRIHPREAPNKRDSVRSQNLGHLQRLLDRPFQRCRVVWPDDPLSSYDIGQVADLVLISWSTIGLEFARLGLPVLAATHGLYPFPLDDFMQRAGSSTEYFRLLLEMVQQPTRLEAILHAWRWYNLFHLGYALDFSDLVPDPGYSRQPPFRMPRSAGQVVSAIRDGQDVLEMNRRELETGQSEVAKLAESAAVIRELRRVFHFLMTGEDGSGDFSLRVASSADEARQRVRAGPGSRHVVISGLRVSYFLDARMVEKASSICARLGPLIAQHEA